MRLLFWNTKAKPLYDLVAAIARDEDSDIVALAEEDTQPRHLTLWEPDLARFQERLRVPSANREFEAPT